MKKLYGNTYPIKDIIKSKGGRWDGFCWIVPESVYDELVQEMSNQEKKLIKNQKRPVMSGQLWEPCQCGEEPVYMSHSCFCETCIMKGYS